VAVEVVVAASLYLLKIKVYEILKFNFKDLLNCSCKAAEPVILLRPNEIPSINAKIRPPTTAAPNIAPGPSFIFFI